MAFLALPGNLHEDKVKRPYKSLSRLEGISLNSRGDFFHAVWDVFLLFELNQH